MDLERAPRDRWHRSSAKGRSSAVAVASRLGAQPEPMLTQPRKARAQEADERDGAKPKSQPGQDGHALEGADGKATSQRAEYASVQAIAGAEPAQHIVIDRFFLYREAAECEAQSVPEQGYIPRRKIAICGDATANGVDELSRSA